MHYYFDKILLFAKSGCYTTISVQLCGVLQSPNRTVTAMGTTTIRMAGGATCVDNACDATSTAQSRIFRLIKAVNL
jgi:hypothetical protein